MTVLRMYRILRTAGQSGDRRRRATHPTKAKPAPAANWPSEVRSWDITKPHGPGKGDWYHLYVLIDIHSDTSSAGSSALGKTARSPRN